MPRSNIGSVRARLASIGLGRLILFLDFDGTLVQIATRPEDVVLPETAKRSLRRIARSVPVVVVSGRSVKDLRRMIGIGPLHYIGLHGFSYAAPGKPPTWLAARPSRRVVQQWKQTLDAVAGPIDGAWVEDKGISVALHDRQVTVRARPRLRRRAIGALQGWLFKKQICLLRGKRVLEVLPAIECDKGTAVSRVLQEPWARSRVPVYFGDDVTDLPALALVERSGTAIQIGSIRGTPKNYFRLPDSKAVEQLLRDLADRLDR